MNQIKEEQIGKRDRKARERRKREGRIITAKSTLTQFVFDVLRNIQKLIMLFILQQPMNAITIIC